MARYVVATNPAALSADDLAQIDGFRKLVRVDATRLTEKNSERLAALETPEMERRFRCLPDDCFAAADDLLAAGRPIEAAHLHSTALALGIAIHKPLRRMNLTKLDFHRHFLRDDKGRIIALQIPAKEVFKSPVEIHAWLPSKLIDRINKQWLIYRPIIAAEPQTGALFANREGKPLHPNTLAESIVKLVRSGIGIEFNMHLIRHWAACKIFEDDPRNGPIAQALLGHRNPASTVKYGTRSTRAAHRLYGEILERRMRSPKPRRSRS